MLKRHDDPVLAANLMEVARRSGTDSIALESRGL